MYKTPFLITGNFGNNAFSFKKRHKPTLYVPPLTKGTLGDAEIGEHVVFEDFDEGILKSCVGLKNLLEFYWHGVPAVLIDNHNHVFYFWYRSGLRNATLIHIDQHKDMRVPPESFKGKTLREAFKYTNEVLNVGDYIVPAREAGTIGKIQFVTSEASLSDEKFFDEKNKILNIDLDFFAPELDYINFEKAKHFIQEHAKTASLITIATSPFFIEQERALRILKKLA